MLDPIIVKFVRQILPLLPISFAMEAFKSLRSRDKNSCYEGFHSHNTSCGNGLKSYHLKAVFQSSSYTGYTGVENLV